MVSFVRGDEDKDGIITQISYENTDQGILRTLELFKVFRRDQSVAQAVTVRSHLKRFGAAYGTEGSERGVTMISGDEFNIEDPFNDEKNLDERLVERLKSSVKFKPNVKREDLEGLDQLNSRRHHNGSNPRSPPFQRDFSGGFQRGAGRAPSPAFFRAPSPGYNGYNRGSPSRQNRANSNSSPGYQRNTNKTPPKKQHPPL